MAIREPLRGIRIIEIGDSEAAGMCTLLLSDFGAEVIKIDGLPFSEKIRLCDRGKKRVKIDFTDKKQRQLYKNLAVTTDIVVDGCRPGLMKAYEITPESMASLKPELIYVCISGYGTKGAYAEHLWDEAAVQAESGLVSITGQENGEPIRCGGDVAAFTGGMNGCIAALMALAGKQKNGCGRIIDVSMMDSILFGLENQFSLYLKSGKIPGPKGNTYALSAPVGNYVCADGRELVISVATERQWKAFANAMEKQEWLECPDFINVARRLKNNKELEKKVAEAFLGGTREEWIKRLQEHACIYGCINDLPSVVDHIQPKARKMWIEAVGPGENRTTVPCNPIVMDGRKFYKSKISRCGENNAEFLFN